MSGNIPPEYKVSHGGFKDDILIELNKALTSGAKDGEGPGSETISLGPVLVSSSSYKDVNVEDISSEGNGPDGERDSWKLVYITMILHGVGTLMPWNMIITANDYFVHYKLSKEYTGQDTKYAYNFLSYVGLASQLPSLIFVWANIFVRFGGNLNKRIIYSLAVEALLLIFTIILATADTSAYPAEFFWLTIFSVVVLNTAGGIYQNCIFGIGSKLGCIGGLVLGSNICGTFTSVVNLISLALAPTARKAGMFYFSAALLVIVACLVTYFILPRNKFYRYKLEIPKASECTPHKEMEIVEVHATGSGGIGTKLEKPPYLLILKQCGMQYLNIFLIYLVTLTIFPSIHSEIKRLDEGFPISDKYFAAVTCFLTFNTFALIGNLVSEVVLWPKPDMLWVPVTGRFLFIPFFLLCNYQPRVGENPLPCIFNDWIYLVGGAMMGFTNGYFCSLAMIYCPRSVSSDNAAISGMFAIAFLVTGVMVGVGLSWLISVTL